MFEDLKDWLPTDAVGWTLLVVAGWIGLMAANALWAWLQAASDARARRRKDWY